MRGIRCLITVGMVAWLCLSAAAAEPEAPYGLSQRIAWTTSRVVGSPEPPLPYRSAPVFAAIKFDHPLYVLAEPGANRMFVIEQKGKILEFPNDPAVKVAEAWLTLADRDTYGMTFHPGYAQNRFVYIFSNGPNSEKSKLNRISRFTVAREAPFRPDPKSELIVIEWVSNGHNGGDMAFGPDGMLYASAGDGTSDSDTNITGQDISDLVSGMLRIDVDHPEPGKNYAVPPDNPFLNIPKARPELWAYGFRNPWRIHIDPAGRLWCGDIGQDQWEMIEIVKKGDNYGWSVVEGGHPFYLERQTGPTPIAKPLIAHPHSIARSITGGVTYRGSKFPPLKDAYIYGDYGTGKIWMVRVDGDTITEHREIADTPFSLIGFGLDPQGELYFADYNGGLHTLEPAPAQTSVQEFPRLLSQTGLFESVGDNKPRPALIPYEVNSPLWSDGAVKERFLALPELSQIEFNESAAWKFPERTVLVKTFSLPTGEAGALRRIETRLMVLQQNEWVGYTYVWNPAQTDAELVDAAGRDQAYEVADPTASNGKRMQIWHFPSRTECMVCHSRAASYVLGLTTAQMNRAHAYGPVTDNQLRTLAHIGVFKAPGAKAAEPAKTIAAFPLPKAVAELPRLPDPQDPAAALETRVRSYLHANCAQCHVDAGGGNSAIDLAFLTAREKTKLLDVPPLHDKLQIENARLVAPGDPARSVLLKRLSTRGRGQMPPLATSVVDQAAVKLIEEWIQSVKP